MRKTIKGLEAEIVELKASRDKAQCDVNRWYQQSKVTTKTIEDLGKMINMGNEELKGASALLAGYRDLVWRHGDNSDEPKLEMPEPIKDNLIEHLRSYVMEALDALSEHRIRL